MPATVVHAREAADVRSVALLHDGQRVHVGAQAHAAGSAARTQDADDAGAADAFVHFQAQLAQGRSDNAGGAALLESKLWVGVQVSPQRDQVGNQVGDFLDGRRLQHAVRDWRAPVVMYCPGVMPNTLLKWREKWLWS